jgi:hypothetical protein
MSPRPDPAASANSRLLLKRAGWLLGCFAGGGIVGVAGSALTGSDLWYLAIPAAIAIVWLFVADPTKCEPCAGQEQPRRGE